MWVELAAVAAVPTAVAAIASIVQREHLRSEMATYAALDDRTPIEDNYLKFLRARYLAFRIKGSGWLTTVILAVAAAELVFITSVDLTLHLIQNAPSKAAASLNGMEGLFLMCLGLYANVGAGKAMIARARWEARIMDLVARGGMELARSATFLTSEVRSHRSEGWREARWWRIGSTLLLGLPLAIVGFVLASPEGADPWATDSLLIAPVCWSLVVLVAVELGHPSRGARSFEGFTQRQAEATG